MTVTHCRNMPESINNHRTYDI